MKNVLSVLMGAAIFMVAYFVMDASRVVEQRVDRLEHRMVLQPYHYILTLQDSFWVEVRRPDSSLVGQVWCDTTTELGKLFYHDNE